VPRILYWLAGLFGALLLLVVLWMLCSTDSTEGTLIRFEQASRCEEPPSIAPLNSKGIATVLDQPVHTTSDCWHPMVLPENNKPQNIKLDVNKPQLRRIWYRVRWTIPEHLDTTKPLMVYSPRIIANAWQVRVDGIPSAENRSNWRFTVYTPLAVTFFVTTTAPKDTLDIDIGVVASEADGYSMSRISIGDASKLHSQQVFREYLQVTVQQASSAVMFMTGIFFMCLWLARRSETEYLMLTFLSFAYGIGYLRFILLQTYEPQQELWLTALLTHLPSLWTVWLYYLVAARFADYTNRWLEWLLWCYVISLSLIMLLFTALNYDFGSLYAVFSLTIGVFCISAILRQTFFTPSIELRALSFTMIVSMLAGINDTAILLNFANPEGLLLSNYCGLLLFATCLFIIQHRYAKAITGQEQLNSELSVQLAEGEALNYRLKESELELRIQHSRVRELERIQTLADERQRLMHDMHDGLGSSLLSTLAAIEKNNLPHDAVADALRGCIDDLRLVIDSLEPTTNDIVTLLGTIRYRLGQRLDAAGLELIWEINDLPPLPWLEPPDALNVLRLVQEALVNVLKHANASQVRVTTRNLGNQVEIQIQDNGIGFDPDTIKPGRGSHSQAKRADKLGGGLLVDSIIGNGTKLRLILPIYKNGTK
jgi:signal transduction histidine kinase